MTSPAKTRMLYSLNDQAVLVDLGQFGNWTVNARPENAPWGVTVIEDQQVRVDLGDDKSEVKVVPADDFVNDIIGRYPGEGFFSAFKDDSPSAAEVEAAKKEFELADLSRIATAQQVWDAKKDRSKIDARARHAARRRNQVVDWAVGVVVELKVCPACGENIRMSAIKCKHCSTWLDGRDNVTPAKAAEAADAVENVHALLTGRKK